jgi:hypothetical protein
LVIFVNFPKECGFPGLPGPGQGQAGKRIQGFMDEGFYLAVNVGHETFNNGYFGEKQYKSKVIL